MRSPKRFISTVWDKTVRFRTWLFNAAVAFLILAPELIGAPEVILLIPEELRPWAAAFVVIANIIMRPWPAVRATDPEVQASKKKGAR
jgi:hypothetical protein